MTQSVATTGGHTDRVSLMSAGCPMLARDLCTWGDAISNLGKVALKGAVACSGGMVGSFWKARKFDHAFPSEPGLIEACVSPVLGLGGVHIWGLN